MRPVVEEMRVKRSKERVSRWGGRRNLISANVNLTTGNLLFIYITWQVWIGIEQE